MKVRIPPIVVALTLLCPTPVRSGEAVRPVEVYGGLVALDVPESWHEIPPDVLEFYSLQSAERSGGRNVEIYQHGFRPGDPEAAFQTPQILIQIKESGRLASGQFRHLPPVATVRQQGEERIEERMGPFMEDHHLNEVRFDRASHSIHITNTLDLKFEGKVIVDSVSYLTERGLFTIHCYASIGQNTKIQPVFDQILGSIRIDETICYRPRLSDRLPPRPALISYGIAGVLAFAVLVVLLLERRRRSQ